MTRYSPRCTSLSTGLDVASALKDGIETAATTIAATATHMSEKLNVISTPPN
jgi:hypothetical protein